MHPPHHPPSSLPPHYFFSFSLSSFFPQPVTTSLPLFPPSLPFFLSVPFLSFSLSLSLFHVPPPHPPLLLHHHHNPAFFLLFFYSFLLPSHPSSFPPSISFSSLSLFFPRFHPPFNSPSLPPSLASSSFHFICPFSVSLFSLLFHFLIYSLIGKQHFTAITLCACSYRCPD